MKKRKGIFTMLAAAVLFCILGSSSLKASAAAPVTYTVRYQGDDQEWGYRTEGLEEFEDPDTYRELYYLKESLKDGDVVVVYYDGSANSDPSLDLGNVRLSNLTVAQSDGFSVIFSGPVDECFLLTGVSCAINSEINTVHAYDSIVCNLNKNVKVLHLTLDDSNDTHSTIGCAGTVGHFYTTDTDYAPYNLYNFQPGSFYFVNGHLETPEEQYSTTASPSAPTQPSTSTAQPSGTTQPSAPAAQPSGSTTQPSGDYDSVPKTGNTTPALWLLLGTAILCLGGFLGLRYSGRQ